MKLKRFKEKKYPTYNIGDRGPGGGIIFLTPSSNGNSTGQYFEAATNVFYNTSSIIVAPSVKLSEAASANLITSTSIGSGKINTITLNTYWPAISNSGLYYTKNYNNKNHSDWYIPSKDEFGSLVLNGDILTGSGDLGVGGGKWATSSLDGNSKSVIHVYHIALNTYEWITDVASYPNFYIIPVRSFSPYGV